MDMISPGVYVRITDLSTYLQEIPGTIGFIPFLSERGEDNVMLFASSIDLPVYFGEPNLHKYGQGLYNAINYKKASTWLYVMRVLPVQENIPEDYAHPVVSGEVLPAPTFAHMTLGVVYQTDSNGNLDRVAPFVRYFDPLYGVPEDPDATLDLDEQFGYVTKSISATTIRTDDIDLEYNPLIVKTDTTIPALLTETNWEELKIDAILDPSNGFTDKYFPGYTDPSSYWYNFNPAADSFKPLFVIYGVGRGPWYNSLRIGIIPDVTNPGYYKVTVFRYDDTTNTLSPIEGPFVVSFDPKDTDYSGESIYIGYVLNKYSKYVRIQVNADNLKWAVETPDPKDPNKRIIDRVLEPFYEYNPGSPFPNERVLIELRNGSFGALYDEKGRLDQVVFANAMNYALSGYFDDRVVDIYDNDISLIFDAGYPLNIKLKILDYVLTRGDCFAVIDLPRSKDPDEAVTIRNNEMASFNHWQAAIYAPYSKIYSEHEGKELWVAPSYHMAYVIPRSDKMGELWFAPAGFNRGTFQCLELQYVVKNADLDRWYLNQINPLTKRMGTYVVWGNLTSQRKPSALQNVNIARLVLYIAKSLRKFCEYFIFEQNDPITWQQIEAGIRSFLAEIQARRGLELFNVTVGATEYEKKQKMAHATILLVPVRPLEKILLDFIIK